jgi:hypothetical protein
MATYFPLISDMLILSRSSTSKIPHSGRPEGVLDLSKYIKKHTIKTVTVEHYPEEKETFQYLHLMHALDYEEKVKGPKDDNRDQYSGPGEGVTKTKEAKAKGGSFATGPLRDLAILTGGTTGGIFNVRAKMYNQNTLVAKQQEWRDKGYSLEYIGKHSNPAVESFLSIP